MLRTRAGRFPGGHDQASADTEVCPLCVHRLRYQPAHISTADHQRHWRNRRTSTERYWAALRGTSEQIIPPPLNQRVRGSSPWRRARSAVSPAQRPSEAPPPRGFTSPQGRAPLLHMITSRFVSPASPPPGAALPAPQRQLPPHPPRGGQVRAHRQVLHRGRRAPGRVLGGPGSPANCERGQARGRQRLHRRPARALEARHRPEPLRKPPGILQVVRRRRRTRAEPDDRHEATPAPRRTTTRPHRRPAPAAVEVVRGGEWCEC